MKLKFLTTSDMRVELADARHRVQDENFRRHRAVFDGNEAVCELHRGVVQKLDESEQKL